MVADAAVGDDGVQEAEGLAVLDGDVGLPTTPRTSLVSVRTTAFLAGTGMPSAVVRSASLTS